MGITSKHIKIILWAISLFLSQFSKAQTDSSYTLDKLFTMSLEELLDQKVVTASKENEEIEDVPASVIVISKEEIENYGYQSVEEILENTTGFFKHDDYRNVGFGVRGFFTNVYNRSYVLLVNGIEQSSPFNAWNSSNLTTIQVESIERIEIIKGPMAVIYGNNAFFGAINIITKSQKEEASSEWVAAYGAENSYRSNIKTNIKEKNFETTISAGFTETDGRNIPFSPILDSVQDYSGNYHKSATMEGFFSRSTRYMNATGAFNNFYFGLSYDVSDRNLIHNVSPVLSDEYNTYQNQTTRLSLGYQKKLGEKLSINLNTQYHINNIDQSYNKSNVSPKIEYGFLQSTAKYLMLEGRLNYNFSKKLKLIIGTQYSTTSAKQYVDVPPTFYAQINETENNLQYLAVFSQFSYKLSPKIELVGGVRMDYQPEYSMQNTFSDSSGVVYYKDYSYFYNKPILIPRLAAIFRMNSQHLLKVMVGQAVSRTSISENFILNNDSKNTLYPQKITTTELNYNYIQSKYFTFNISLYYSSLNDLIVRTTEFDNGNYTNDFNNSGKYTTYGSDIQVIFKPTYKWLFDISCNLQKTKDEKNNISAAYSPNTLVYLKSVYKFNRHFTISVTGNYVSSMKSFWDETPANVNDPNSALVGRVHETTPGYVNLGTNIRIENLFSKGIFLAVHAYNLLDSRKYYAPTEVNADYLPNGTYDQGIKLYANLGVKF